MKSIVGISGLIVIIIVGCDTYNPVDYNLINESDKNLRIDYSYYGILDTVVFIDSKQRKTLVIRPIIGSSASNPEEGNDTIWMIRKLLIYKSDTILLNKPFRLRNRWGYNYLDHHHSELNLTITNKDL